METRRQGRWTIFAGLMLMTSSGCFLHLQVEPPAHTCNALPMPCAEQQEHVYVFFINGFDPMQYANLVGVRDQFQLLGYRNCYYGQLYHSKYFAREMRRVFSEDPQARFALVGFSLGAVPAYNLAQDAYAEGLPVDLVVMIAGKGIRNLRQPDDHPIRVVDIQAFNYIFRAQYPDPADRIHESNAGHFQAPTDRRTIETLQRELMMVAEQVPVTMPAESAPEHSLSQMLKPVDQITPHWQSSSPVYVHTENVAH